MKSTLNYSPHNKNYLSVCNQLRILCSLLKSYTQGSSQNTMNNYSHSNKNPPCTKGSAPQGSRYYSSYCPPNIPCTLVTALVEQTSQYMKSSRIDLCICCNFICTWCMHFSCSGKTPPCTLRITESSCRTTDSFLYTLCKSCLSKHDLNCMTCKWNCYCSLCQLHSSNIHFRISHKASSINQHDNLLHILCSSHCLCNSHNSLGTAQSLNHFENMRTQTKHFKYTWVYLEKNSSELHIVDSSKDLYILSIEDYKISMHFVISKTDPYIDCRSCWYILCNSV